MTNMEKYIKVFMEIFGVNEEELTDDFSSETSENWDSVTQMNLITAIEGAFDIMIDIDDIYEFTSFGKGIKLLKKYEVEI